MPNSALTDREAQRFLDMSSDPVTQRSHRRGLPKIQQSPVRVIAFGFTAPRVKGEVFSRFVAGGSHGRSWWRLSGGTEGGRMDGWEAPRCDLCFVIPMVSADGGVEPGHCMSGFLLQAHLEWRLHGAVWAGECQRGLHVWCIRFRCRPWNICRLRLEFALCTTGLCFNNMYLSLRKSREKKGQM